MTADGLALNAGLRRARYVRLQAMARRYGWWLGRRSGWLRSALAHSGWRLSRLGYRCLGRPSGALAWPLGLALLVLNAAEPAARDDLPWAKRCLDGLMDAAGRPALSGVAIDRGGLAYAALRVAELSGEPRYRQFARALGAEYLALPGAATGCIPYAVGRSEVLVDSVAFLCPLMARLARLEADPHYRAVALAQLESIWRAGQADSGWVTHGFDVGSKQPLGLAGWGRGVAWLLLGIADTVIELEAGEVRTLWQQRAMALIDRLRMVQRADGHWDWRLTRLPDMPDVPGLPGAEPLVADSSVTAIVGYAVARLLQAGLIEGESYAALLARCCQALDQATQADGRVGQSSGEAGGIGSYSTHYGNYLWAQAPAVALDRIVPTLIDAGMLRTSP